MTRLMEELIIILRSVQFMSSKCDGSFVIHCQLPWLDQTGQLDQGERQDWINWFVRRAEAEQLSHPAREREGERICHGTFSPLSIYGSGMASSEVSCLVLGCCLQWALTERQSQSQFLSYLPFLEVKEGKFPCGLPRRGWETNKAQTIDAGDHDQGTRSKTKAKRKRGREKEREME